MAERRLVHIVDEVPELEGSDQGPVLVVALDGFLDAGNASALVVAHMAGSHPAGEAAGRVVASFEVDELHDYRARRPALTFHENHYTDYEAPRLNVRLLRDAHDTPYLLLSGPEPDIRWEAFCRAVREVVDEFDVRLVMSIGSVPMAVPHTRPVQLTNHGTSEDLLVLGTVFSGEIRVPASAQALLEIRLGEWGYPATGFVAHIPHYLAQFDYPLAAIALLNGIEDVTGLLWTHASLEQAAESRAAEIQEQISDSDEVRSVVSGLEQQYDAFEAGRGGSLLAQDEELPTGEEIGEQFEQFLAGLDESDGN